MIFSYFTDKHKYTLSITDLTGGYKMGRWRSRHTP